MLLVRAGYKANNSWGVIEVDDASHSSLANCLNDFAEEESVSNTDLAKLSANKHTEKYDHLLPESLLNEGYGAKAFDVSATREWLAMANHMNLLQPV